MNGAVVWVSVAPCAVLRPYHDRYECRAGGARLDRRIPTLLAAAVKAGMPRCTWCAQAKARAVA